jgi:fructokinase
MLKLSQEELTVLSRILRFDGQASAFTQHLREAFEIDAIALTKGENGSELLDAKRHVTSAGVKSTRVADTVGAGDGFAAMLAVGYLQGWPPEKILQLASEFAARICEIPGAVPLQDSFYQPFKYRLIEENEHVR